MAKKAAVKEEPKKDVLADLITSIENNITDLTGELEKVLLQAAASAKRARALTSTLAKQFKEFRAMSVAHFKK